MFRILQQKQRDDYVLATGQTHTERSFAKMAFSEVGIDIEWQRAGVQEVGVWRRTKRVLVSVDPVYFRPAEVDLTRQRPARGKLCGPEEADPLPPGAQAWHCKTPVRRTMYRSRTYNP
jgi:GDPmannose 4,6-dehydratase